MKSTLIEIKIGDKIQEKDGRCRVGILKDVKFSPNGNRDPSIVALFYVYLEEEDKMVESCSGNWTPVEDEDLELYAEFYPSVHLNHLCDEILRLEKA